MRHSKRNIPDAVSPQNPLNKTDITPDRVQEHLKEKTSMEEILKPDDEANETEEQKMDRLRRESERRHGPGL